MATGHVPSRFENGWTRKSECKNSKQETDQTVGLLTITKALSKTTNCTCIAKHWKGTTKKISGALHRTFAPHFLLKGSNHAQRHLKWSTYVTDRHKSHHHAGWSRAGTLLHTRIHQSDCGIAVPRDTGAFPTRTRPRLTQYRRHRLQN